MALTIGVELSNSKLDIYIEQKGDTLDRCADNMMYDRKKKMKSEDNSLLIIYVPNARITS